MTATAPPGSPRRPRVPDPKALLKEARRRRGLRLATYALVLLASGGCVAVAATTAAPAPSFQASSIASLDREHGVLAREDWSCTKSHGCPAQILASDDGGTTWRVTYRTTMPVRLYAIRGTHEVWASTGDNVLESRDRGLSWRRVLRFPAAAIAFADPSHGWLLPAGSMFNHPKPLLATSSGGRNWQRIASPCRRQWGLTVALSRPTPSQGWVACTSEAGAGSQGKEVWSTGDGGRSWRLRARTKLPGLPAAGLRNQGDLPLFGYVTGIAFLPDRRGWLWESRGWLLMTRDGGRSWRRSPITKADTVAAQSASLLSDRLGYVLLRGCTVKLVRTQDSGASWTTIKRWRSPTRC
jgi:photosystem II stability/assembly factor-like uncharacterized protein